MGVGEPRKGASELRRHLPMAHSETPDVHLVGDSHFPGDRWTALASPSEGGVDHPAFRNKGGAVPLVKAEVLVGMVEGIAEQLRAPFEAANELLGVGVDQQLVRVEAVPGFWFVWPIRAVAVGGPRPGCRQVAVPNLVGVFRQLYALELGPAIQVEETDLDLGGVSGKDREVDAEPIPGRTKRERSPLAKACSEHRRELWAACSGIALADWWIDLLVHHQNYPRSGYLGEIGCRPLPADNEGSLLRRSNPRCPRE